MTDTANLTDDPEIAGAIAARRQRLDDASRQRADAHAAHEARLDACRNHAELHITPVLAAVAEQVSREAGIKAEIESDLNHASPWIAIKFRVPPRSAEVRFTFDLDQSDIAVRTTGEGELTGPRLERRPPAEVTSEYVRQQVRDAFVHAAT